MRVAFSDIISADRIFFDEQAFCYIIGVPCLLELWDGISVFTDYAMNKRIIRITVLGSICAGILLIGYFVVSRLLSSGQNPTLFEAMQEAVFYPRDFICDLSRIQVDADGIHHQGQTARFALMDGWSPQTEKGVWGIGPRSVLQVFFQDTFSRLLYLECRPFLESEESPLQVLTVQLNNIQCGTVTLSPHWDRYAVLLPDSAFQGGSNTLVISYAFSISPQELGIGSDLRPFAARFRKIGFFRVPGAQNTFAAHFIKNLGDFLPKAEQIRVKAVQEPHAIVLDQSGSLVFPFQFPENTADLEFNLENFRSWEDGEQLSIYIEPMGGDKEQLITLSRKNSWPGNSEQNRFVQIPVHRFSGMYCFVTFELEALKQAPLTKIDTPVISHQKVSLEKAGRSSRIPAEAAVISKQDYPDIVLIILDAARADHFGCYGYDRDTTPHIDILARGGMIFTQAYATAPYTVCSVPTMITGASFLDHKVVGTHHKLNEGMTTLAEYLQAAGYATLGFSSTPNNSRTKGFDQGFDEFYEAWTFAEDRKNSRDAFQLSRRVIQTLSEHKEGARPFFLQVHYVPPHEPYEPSEEFDVFGDPGYRGEMDGSIERLSELKLNRTVPAGEDITELISLYDGNLRMADFALEELLKALRERERWQNTLLLITSDHGEALYEHGRLGHNSTLYEEMLHVPFILHLPRGCAGFEVDKAQLVSLEDIVPTLLGLLQIRPKSYIAGMNIFEQRRFWQPGDKPRFIFSRSSGDPIPFYSYRSRRWKIIFKDVGNQLLFDLFDDPGETQNLLHRRPDMYNGLKDHLGRILSQKRPSELTVDKASMSKEEEAALKSLGYIK
jgi:choline-sulfatase